MSTKLLNVLVVDDSPTVRINLVKIINSDPDLNVVGEAVNGTQAIKMATALHPDVILMDIFMPGMDGLEASREIMHLVPTPIVAISGSVSGRETTQALQAISSGALTAVEKLP